MKLKITPGKWKRKGPSKDRITTGTTHHHAGDFAILDSQGDIIAEIYYRVSANKVVEAETNALAFSRVRKMLELLVRVSAVMDQDEPLAIEARALLEGLVEE